MLVAIFHHLQNVIWQWVEEGVGPLDKPFQASGFALRLLDRDQLGDGLSGLGNDDLLARGGGLQ
jgi:hypothetical protein